MEFFFILLFCVALYFFLKHKWKKDNPEARKDGKKVLSINYDDSSTGFKHYLVFDTETDGLPIDPKGDPNDVENWPRIVQLCWMILDSDFKLVDLKNHYIKTDFEINQEAINIHGITNEHVQENGIPIAQALTEFMEDLETTEILIAHNLDFDVPIIDAELLRLGKKKRLFRKRKICTLRYGSGLTKKFGTFRRFPKLTYLCTCIYGGNEIDFTSHDARQDVILTGKIFEQLVKHDFVKEQWIKPKEKKAKA